MPHKNIEKRRESSREASRRYRQRHPDRRRESSRRYWLTHHDKCLTMMRNYRQAHPDKVRRWKIKATIKQRKDIIDAYGGVCTCCGETELAFLTIDHIDGGGTKHRELIGFGQRFYSWLKTNGYPQGYQVLCYNCNCAKSFSGGCPHKGGSKYG